jgi:hypothetical protein
LERIKTHSYTKFSHVCLIATLTFVLICFCQIEFSIEPTKAQSTSTVPPSSLGPITFQVQGGTFSFQETLDQNSIALHYISAPQAQITISAQANTPAGSYGTLEVNLNSDEGQGKSLSTSQSFRIPASETFIDSAINLHYEDPTTKVATEFWGVRLYFYVQPSVTLSLNATSIPVGGTVGISGTISPPDWSGVLLTLNMVRDGIEQTSLNANHATGESQYSTTFTAKQAGEYTITASCSNLNARSEIPLPLMRATATATFTVTGESQSTTYPTQTPEYSPTPSPIVTSSQPESTDTGEDISLLGFLHDIYRIPFNLVMIILIMVSIGMAIALEMRIRKGKKANNPIAHVSPS